MKAGENQIILHVRFVFCLYLRFDAVKQINLYTRTKMGIIREKLNFFYFSVNNRPVVTIYE